MEMKLDITGRCIKCDYCRFVCPENAILTDGKVFVIDSWSCTQCTNCIEVCPTDAVKPVEIDIIE